MVDEPGAVTPIFLPFRSVDTCSSRVFFEARDHDRGRALQDELAELLPLRLQDVCSNAPDTTSALPPTGAFNACEPPAKSEISTSSPSSLK